MKTITNIIHPLFALSTLACFALLQNAQAVVPPPDGGYAGENTAEGTNALFSLTTGIFNTALGFEALYSNTTGSYNTATGVNALRNNTADFNTAYGEGALQANTTGGANAAFGEDALATNTVGDWNTATGTNALIFNNTGRLNTAIGANALYNHTTGTLNIALGWAAGDLTIGDNNIAIGNIGAAADVNTIRIGAQGAVTDEFGVVHPAHRRTFIAGIAGTAVNGRPVIINANGLLGTAPSSERFKEQIKPMGNASEAILALKPVTFRYKKEIDPEPTPEFGLVAEDVEKVNPDLVVRDADGKAYTVRYEAVNAMLLNEFLKEHRKVEQQRKDFEAALARQQKQIDVLTEGLQKVSAQLELSKFPPQTVANNQ